jgi:hypothetical protein
MEDRFTLQLLPPVPDPRRRFTARMDPGDKYTIRTTDTGLLTSSTAPAATPAAQQLGTVVATHPSASRSTGQSRACSAVDGLAIAPATQVRPFTITVTVDPTVPADLARAEGQLCSLGARYRFVLTQVGKSSPRVITSSSDGLDPRRRVPAGATERRTSYQGFVYRRPEPYVFAIYEEEEGGEAVHFVSSVQVSLPNLAPIEVVNNPDLYIRTQQDLVLRDGMLAARSDVPVQRQRGLRIRFESGSEQKRADAKSTTPAHATPTTAP